MHNSKLPSAHNKANASTRSISSPDTSQLSLQSILTVREAAATLRISSRTLSRLCEVGEGPPRIQLSERRIAFFADDIAAWANSRRVAKQTV